MAIATTIFFMAAIVHGTVYKIVRGVALLKTALLSV
jgi:hypothetical protein